MKPIYFCLTRKFTNLSKLSKRKWNDLTLSDRLKSIVMCIFGFVLGSVAHLIQWGFSWVQLGYTSICTQFNGIVNKFAFNFCCHIFTDHRQIIRQFSFEKRLLHIQCPRITPCLSNLYSLYNIDENCQLHTDWHKEGVITTFSLGYQGIIFMWNCISIWNPIKLYKEAIAKPSPDDETTSLRSSSSSFNISGWFSNLLGTCTTIRHDCDR